LNDLLLKAVSNDKGWVPCLGSYVLNKNLFNKVLLDVNQK